MKVAQFDAVGKPLCIADVDDPKPGTDGMIIKVCRCGICGSDLHITEEPETFGASKGDVLGHEFSGEVLEVGSKVKGLKAGDFVSVAPLHGCGKCDNCLRGEPAWCENMELIGGGYAQYAAVTERQSRKLPWGINAADGALAEPFSVALHGVVQSKMKQGDSVLIVGAGAIGLAVAFWARRMGAGKVVVTSRGRYQEDRAMSLGASHFVQSNEDMPRKVSEICGGQPDVVFECVGKVGLIDHCIDLVRPRGTVLVLGLCTHTDHMDSFRAITKEVTIIMSVFFNMHEFVSAIDALDSGQYSPQNLITETVSLDAMPDAFEKLRDRTTQCKILVDPFGS